MKAFVVGRLSRTSGDVIPSCYLERIPFDGSVRWQAGLVQYATPMTINAALAYAVTWRAHDVDIVIQPDPLRRQPQIGVTS